MSGTDSTPGADDRSPRDESLGAATRALRDATVALTRLIRDEVAAVGPDVNEAVNSALREAARGLTDVSEKVARNAATSDRRRNRAEQTRSDLLDAAERVIARKGYEGASVEDIASDAGYTKGALYSNFGSKSGLFIALAHRWFDAPDAGPGARGARIDGLFTAVRDHDAGDAAALRRWLTAAQEDPQLLLPIEFAAFALRHPGSRDELGGLLAAALDRVAQQIAALRTGADPTATPEQAPTEHDHDTALAVVSVYLTANLLGAATGSPTSSPAAVARVVERLLADRR